MRPQKVMHAGMGSKKFVYMALLPILFGLVNTKQLITILNKGQVVIRSLIEISYESRGQEWQIVHFPKINS